METEVGDHYHLLATRPATHRLNTGDLVRRGQLSPHPRVGPVRAIRDRLRYRLRLIRDHGPQNPLGVTSSSTTSQPACKRSLPKSRPSVQTPGTRLLPVMARLRHAAMSEVRLLSGRKRTSRVQPISVANGPRVDAVLWRSALYRVGACTAGDVPRSIRRQARDSVAHNPIPLANLRDLTRSDRLVNG